MPQDATNAARNGSRSIIMQPEDIVALTADEAIADIESAVRAITREKHNGTEPRRLRK